MCSVTELKDEFQKYMSASCDYYSEDEHLKEQIEDLKQYVINTFEEMIVNEENMKEVDDLRDEVRNLDKSVKSLWRHQLILAGVLCFTEICDLIVSLFQK